MIDDPFSGIEIEPPAFTAAEAESIARQHYGLSASAVPLVSERDQNFLLTAADGHKTILKIASALEDERVTDFQISALQHVAAKGPIGVATPAIVPTASGASRIALSKSGQSHVARLVTYVDGQPLDEARLTPALCRDFGVRLARLDLALADLTHPGQDPVLLWDMKRAADLRRLLSHVPDKATRRLLDATLDEYETKALPAFDDLRWQVIHNDANPANLLASAGDAAIAGIIDFGDMLRSPLVIELGVAAAYLRVAAGDPLALVGEFVTAYQSVLPLTAAELALLPVLIKVRLATTVTILAWREALRDPDDAYLRQAGSTESSARGFLERLSDIPLEHMTQTLAGRAA